MNQTFGAILGRLRSRSQLTVQGLADKSHVPATLISGLQNHNRQIGEQAARKLGIALGLLDEDLDNFIYLAINNCSEKVLAEFKGFPAEVLNLAAKQLQKHGIAAGDVDRCVLKPRLHDGIQPEAAVFMKDGRLALVEMKVTTR